MTTPVVTEPLSQTLPAPPTQVPPPEQTPPAASPVAAAPSPPAITPPAPAITPPALPAGPDEYTRRRLAEADQMERRLREQEMAAAIGQEVREFEQDLLNRGVTPEDARILAQRFQQKSQSVYQERQRFEQERVQAQAKRDAADYFSQQYKLPPESLRSLMTAQTAPDMEAIAQRERRYYDQEERLRKVEQSRIQPTSLDSGVITGAIPVGGTLDQVETQYVRWDAEHPGGGVNPYEARYRQLLNGGR